jgi:hypothetical protein
MLIPVFTLSVAVVVLFSGFCCCGCGVFWFLCFLPCFLACLLAAHVSCLLRDVTSHHNTAHHGDLMVFIIFGIGTSNYNKVIGICRGSVYNLM